MSFSLSKVIRSTRSLGGKRVWDDLREGSFMDTIIRDSRSSRGRLLLVGLVLALMSGLLTVGSAVSPTDAKASHSSLMTIRGKVSPVNGVSWQVLSGATVKLWIWNGSRYVFSRSTTSNSDGNFAIVAGRNHWFFLSAHRKVGSSCPHMYSWSGSTQQFYTSFNWPNPARIDIPVNGGQVC